MHNTHSILQKVFLVYQQENNRISNKELVNKIGIHHCDRRSSDLMKLGLVEKKTIYYNNKDNEKKKKTMYKITQKGKETDVENVLLLHSTKFLHPRSSTEESIVKQQNKKLNKDERIKFEDFKKNYYWNEQEGKWEKGIQFVTPPPIKTNWLVKIKNLLFSNKN